MKKLLTLSLAAVVALSGINTATAATSGSHDDLLKEVRDQQRVQQQVNAQREQTFRANKNRQAQLLANAKAALNAEEALSARLKNDFDANEIRLNELTDALRVKEGNLGELFGVVRQQSNSLLGDLTGSVISAQYPGREELLQELVDAGTPTMGELREFWLTILGEMTEQSKTTSFTADLVNEKGETVQETITRIGAFNLVQGDEYLFFADNKIKSLQVQPSSQVLDTLASFNNASSAFAPLFVDPTKGGILQLEKLKMSLPARLWAFRGFAGNAVLVLMIIGFLIAIERIVSLYLLTGPAINSQKKSKTPKNNPLGRIMKVYLANKDEDTENLELKLDEAVLKETPKIERGINLIKVIAALGPLLGLLGTVTGMIEVFQSITLHGTGDPRTMADGISKALATTVWGLLAAIPLTFLHAIVAGKSKNIIHTLEEQSTGLMAQHEENNS